MAHGRLPKTKIKFNSNGSGGSKRRTGRKPESLVGKLTRGFASALGQKIWIPGMGRRN